VAATVKGRYGKRHPAGSGAAASKEIWEDDAVPNRSDVAKRAGVSTATVSRVVNGSPSVSPATRQRVEKAIMELQYRPNITAKALRMNRSYNIGFLVPDVTNAYYTEIFKGIHHRAAKEGFFTFLYETDSSDEGLSTLLDGRLDGIVTSVTLPRAVLDSIVGRDIPLVSLGGNVPVPHSRIDIDMQSVTESLVQYLYSQGHRQMGLLVRPTYQGEEHPRIEGFRRALQGLGLDCLPACVEFLDGERYSYVLGYRAMRRLLERLPNLSAVVATNDLVAIGAMAAARHLGLPVPDAMSIVGMDDSEPAAFSHPPLTTFRLPRAEQGTLAAAALLRLMETGQCEHHSLTGELMIRESVTSIPDDQRTWKQRHRRKPPQKGG